MKGNPKWQWFDPHKAEARAHELAELQQAKQAELRVIEEELGAVTIALERWRGRPAERT